MQLTHLGHACVLVEVADTRVLVDPGTFATGWEDLRDLAAVVVTHQHPDHLDVDRLPRLLAANPSALVLVDPGSLRVLADQGIGAQGHGDGATTVGGVDVTAVGELHALIHQEIPRIPNLGVRFDADGEPSLYVPGDALDGEPGDVDVLAFPLSAPWARSREMTAYLRRFNAPVAFPVHDALLSPVGRTLYLSQADSLGGPDTRIRDLAGAGPTRFDRP